MPHLQTHDRRVTAFVDGETYTFGPDHPEHRNLMLALASGDTDRFKELVDVSRAVTAFTHGALKVEDGEVTYNGRAISNDAVTHLLDLMEKGEPHEHFGKFVARLMENPSRGVVRGLWPVLSKMGDQGDGCYLNEDGWIVAYKRVRGDLKDLYSGRVQYPDPDVYDESVNSATPIDAGAGATIQGYTISIPRNECDENVGASCSYGLHFGGMDYVRNFRRSDETVLLVVKVDPADVVSCPEDAWKLRTSRMKVIKRFEGTLDGVRYVHGQKERRREEARSPEGHREVIHGEYRHDIGDRVVLSRDGAEADEPAVVMNRKSTVETPRYLVEKRDGTRIWVNEAALAPREAPREAPEPAPPVSAPAADYQIGDELEYYDDDIAGYRRGKVSRCRYDLQGGEWYYLIEHSTHDAEWVDESSLDEYLDEDYDDYDEEEDYEEDYEDDEDYDD